MNGFMLNTKESTAGMLNKLGLSSTDEIYSSIPENIRLREPFALPEALGEYDLKKVMRISQAEIYRREMLCAFSARECTIILCRQ